jgi:uncharacterized protein YukE
MEKAELIECINNLTQLQKFCKRKAVSKWDEDVKMWTKYSDTIQLAMNCVELVKTMTDKEIN